MPVPPAPGPLREVATHSPIRRIAAALAVAGALAGLVGCSRTVATPKARPLAHELRDALEQVDTLLAPHPWLADSAVRADLLALYGKSAEPLWLSDEGVTPAAGALAAAVSRARTHGLNPRDYAVQAALESAQAVVERSRGGRVPSEQLAPLEVLMSAGYLAYARHLWWGRLPAASLDPEWLWDRDSLPLLPRLARAAHEGFVSRTLESLAPRDTAYLALQAALAQLDREAAGGAKLARGQQPTSFDSLGALRRVELNLERRRWLPRDPGMPRIEVNIPDFTFAFIDSNEVKLRMRVVVGQRTHPTPVFSDAMTYFELNPTWRLPRRIIVEEVVPEMKRDTAYLAKQGIRVLWKRSKQFQEHHYSVVDWSAAEHDTFPYVLRQDPGPLNALGRIKFMLPNEFDVYLHDTPNRGAFQSDRRARSHGCVRLEKPRELLKRLALALPPEVADSLDAYLADSVRRAITLPNRIPVHVQYWTAWVDSKGRLQQRDDIYRLDMRLDHALRTRELKDFAINREIVWGARADSLAAAAAGLKPKRRGDVTP